MQNMAANDAFIICPICHLFCQYMNGSAAMIAGATELQLSNIKPRAVAIGPRSCCRNYQIPTSIGMRLVGGGRGQVVVKSVECTELWQRWCFFIIMAAEGTWCYVPRTIYFPPSLLESHGPTAGHCEEHAINLFSFLHSLRSLFSFGLNHRGHLVLRLFVLQSEK